MTGTAMITNDAVVLGLLAATLGVVFWTAESKHPALQRFYRYCPALLLCYGIPALYNTLGVIDGAGSQLYYVASRYLLPATLVLLTIATDLPAILRLGPKLLVLFLAATATIVLGGPFALLVWQVISPATVDGEVWRGMSTIAGSWIGGSANQAAMKEVFAVDSNLFGTFVAVDVLVASVWMAILLWMAGNQQRLDRASGADTRALESLQAHLGQLEAARARIPRLTDLVLIAAVGFGAMGLSHAVAGPLVAAFEGQVWAERISLTSSFFWIVVVATTLGLLLSLTPARNLEGAGASKVGSLLLYVLIAAVGMQMDLGAVFTNPGLFGVGATWMAFHAISMLLLARLLKVPVFYMAIASQSNVGGAASAPVVAAAFNPSLAPLGVLLAVLGYALGTYGGWLSGLMMQAIATH